MRRLALCLALTFTAACSDGPAELMAQARMATYEKRPQDALRLYRMALDLIEKEGAPEAEVLRARALRGAADVYHYELGDLAQAVSVYRELIAQCPEAPETLEARVILADILELRLHDVRGAINELTAALARNLPQSAELRYRVAKLYFQLQDYAQCDLESQQVASKYVTSPYVDDALLLRAQALGMIEGRRGEAARAFEDLVHRFPDSDLAPHALFELGKLRADAGDDEQAIAYWVDALKGHPQPQLVQSSILRVRTRLAKTTPGKVGDRAVAFDRPPVIYVRKHKTSDEAMGVDSKRDGRDPEGEAEAPAVAEASAPAGAPAESAAPLPIFAPPVLAAPAAAQSGAEVAPASGKVPPPAEPAAQPL